MKTQDKIKELEDSIKVMQQENQRDFGIKQPKKFLSVSHFAGPVILILGIILFLSDNVVKAFFSDITVGNIVIPGFIVILPLIVGIFIYYIYYRKPVGVFIIIIGVITALLGIFKVCTFDFGVLPVVLTSVSLALIIVGCVLTKRALKKYKKTNRRI